MTCWYLAAACQQLGFMVLLEERKRYPRAHFYFGRVKIQFDKTTGHRTPQGVLLKNSMFDFVERGDDYIVC